MDYLDIETVDRSIKNESVLRLLKVSLLVIQSIPFYNNWGLQLRELLGANPIAIRA